MCFSPILLVVGNLSLPAHHGFHERQSPVFLSPPLNRFLRPIPHGVELVRHDGLAEMRTPKELTLLFDPQTGVVVSIDIFSHQRPIP